MTKEKQKAKDVFYVFTSINGVLFDSKYVDSMHGPFAASIEDPILNPKSVSALLYLLETLEEKYDTKLVITSKRRRDMPACIEYLKHNGFYYNKPIFSTKYINGLRGKKIISHMEEDGQDPIRKKTISSLINSILNPNNKKFKNYVVIDSSYFKLFGQIPSSHIIKTDYKHQSLTIDQVQSYLESIGITKEKQPE